MSGPAASTSTGIATPDHVTPRVVQLDVDGPSFATTDELQSSATLIVKGVPVSHVGGSVPGTGGLPQTVYRIKVNDVVQGDVMLVGQVITVFTLGGTANGTTYQANGLQT